MEVIGIAKDGKEACDMIANTRTRYSVVGCYNAIFRWIGSIRKNVNIQDEQKTNFYNAFCSWTS